MNPETKHTPLPWQEGTCCVVATGEVIVTCESDNPDEAEANAAFIVRACNAHYDLVEACYNLHVRLGHILAKDESCDLLPADEEALEAGRAALAKAKGQP